VIRLVEPKPPPAPKPSFWESLPLVGKLFQAPEPTVPDALAKTQTMLAPGPGAVPAPAANADEDAKPRTAGAGGKLSPVNGKTIKCDLCAGLPFEACVYNCPTTAILRKEPQSLFDRGAVGRGR
jgi:ferredoxin